MESSDSKTEVLGDTIIPAINQLQDIFSQVHLDFRLDLPQVAVIGSQSSGKSSVLEALVGRDFLPRGPEICTRRPLVLQLVKQGTSKDKEWGEFLHLPGKSFTDFEEIRHEIQKETDRITGLNKGVSEKPIRLKIFSPHVLTMTLVDLPGLARVPVGDQPSDIEERIRKMISEYIRHATCLILAVSPSNADLVNSDALSMARAVDPDGKRTIGVLTKLDIMDRGTNAVNVLKNDVVPLRLGYIGVVNRCQEDIMNSRSMEDARSSEGSFFDDHPEYREVKDKCGIANLAKRLNGILVDHIRGLLPGLRSTIEKELDSQVEELMGYGEPPVDDTVASRGSQLLHLLDAYALQYTQMLEGCSEHLPVTELAGGARIRHIFRNIFMKGLDEIEPGKTLTEDDIRTAIKNSGGVKGSLLIPDAPFELLVRRSITQLLVPALQCKDFVHGELMRIAGQCAPTDITRFPALQSHLTSTVEEFIDSGAEPAERMIRNLVDCELAYINTDHPSFIGGSKAISMIMDRRNKAGESDEEEELPNNNHKSKHTSAADHNVVVPAKSAGNLRHPATDFRVPMADISGRSHARFGLKGMEPTVYNPAELLGGDRHADSNHRPHNLNSEDERPQPGSTSWLGHFFGLSEHRSTSAVERAHTSLSKPPHTLRVQGSSSEQEDIQVEVTRVLVECYFDIVKRNLQDAVPKAVMHFLVMYVQRGLQQRLIRTLYREELFSEVMNEREDIARRREACQKALQALHAALATLNNLPQTLLAKKTPLQQSSAALKGRGMYGSSNTSNWSPTGFQPHAPVNRKPLSSAARLAVGALALDLRERL